MEKQGGNVYLCACTNIVISCASLSSLLTSAVVAGGLHLEWVATMKVKKLDPDLGVLHRAPARIQ